VADEFPIEVDGGDAIDPDAADPGAVVPGGVASSSRLVHEPKRWARVAVAAALVAMTALGAASWDRIRGRGPDRDDEPTAADRARIEYAQAVSQLGRSHAYSYRGTMRSAGPSPVDPWTTDETDVTMEGTVLLPHSVAREVVVDATGHALETATAGMSVWTRRAPSVAGLTEAAWTAEALPSGLDDSSIVRGSPQRVGPPALIRLVASAADRRPAPPDDAGRTVVTGTIPTTSADPGRPLAGAEVTLTLDDAGAIARIAITAAPADESGVELAVDILRAADPPLTPAEVSAPPRQSLVPADLRAAGIAGVELRTLPEGWALTDARLSPANAPGPWPRDCPGLALEYQDLGAIGEGWLRLDIGAAACDDTRGTAVPVESERFETGGFSGTIQDGTTDTYGTISDGVTEVDFSSDLPAADLATMLSALAPLDLGRDLGS
jgi:hypothetical protein